MTTAAVDIRYYAPKFVVVINGSRLAADISKTILNISVEQELNLLNNFSFEVQDEFRAGQFRWLGHDLFKYGNDVKIHLGYAHHLLDMVEGKIQNIQAEFFQGTAPTFTVTGSDRAYKFLMGRSAAHVFREKKDSEIVEAIAREARLRSTVEGTSITHQVKIKIAGRSYYDFLDELARNNSFELRLSGRELYFGPALGGRREVINLAWGRELINFRPEINTSGVVTDVVVRSWDRNSRSTIEGRAQTGEEETMESGTRAASQIAREIYGDVVEVITDQPVRSAEEANQRASSRLRQANADLVRGTGDTIGIPEIKPGIALNLIGLGKWFSGQYYVEKVRHNISTNGYKTNFTVSRNAL